MAKLDPRQFRDTLEDLGYEPRSYSGRGMMGEQCVAVESGYGTDTSEWEIAQAVALEFGHKTPEPRSDSLGRGIILYWPSVKWED